MQTKKVVIVGPECTGKSELCEFLASALDTVWVEEYARTYIDHLNRPYGPADLPIIASGQLAMEDSLVSKANEILICDTNLYVIKIWSNFKYGYCDPKILHSLAMRKYDLYLLTYIDIPWIPDPQRENPDQRESLYALYLEEMKNQPVPFVEIKGTREHRRKLATESIRKMMQHR